MCKLKSAIITKEGCYMPMDYDSHEKMIKELNLNDTTKSPDFVRVEITPKRKTISTKESEWDFQVDQDYLPEWYSAKWAEKITREKLKGWIKARVITSGEITSKGKERYFLLGNAKAELYDSSSAELYDSSSAELYDSSSAELYDSSSAKLYDSSSARLYSSSSAELYDSSSAELYGSSSARLYSSSSAKLYDSSSAVLCDSSIAIDIKRKIIYTASESNYELKKQTKVRL